MFIVDLHTENALIAAREVKGLKRIGKKNNKEQK